MLIFQENIESEDKDIILYKDYSLRKRLDAPKRATRMSAFEKKKAMEHDQERTRLQCLEVDLSNPLSTIDWQNFVHVLGEVNGLGWVQLLPSRQKASQPCQFNMMHVLP